MDIETINTFQQDLLQFRASLLDDFARCQEEIASGALQGSVGSGQEEGDRSTVMHFSHLKLSKLDSARKTIDQIDHALARIEGQSYGVCLVCDEEICIERLQAIPFAVHCRECQESLDRGTTHEQILVA
jgi:DnaK suppressor protein